MLSALDKTAQEKATKPVFIDLLARSDLESELEAQLNELGIEKAWEISPALVNLGYDKKEIAALAQSFNPAQFRAAIDWLNSSASIYSLLEEIYQGAGRISEIVKALKDYTYLDQAPVQRVNIHEGLDNTLIILRSKLVPGVIVNRDYDPDLPTIEAYGSELNQVWTNFIDNAIDAMEGQGEITLRTQHDSRSVIVEIEDTGSGIPEAIQQHIFDPFFTTKPPGKGTGLGLNISYNIIVQKHQGSMSVSSQPGKTCFEVRLPLHRKNDGA